MRKSISEISRKKVDMEFTDKQGWTWYHIGEGLWVNQYGTLSDDSGYLIELSEDENENHRLTVDIIDPKTGRILEECEVKESSVNIRERFESWIKSEMS